MEELDIDRAFESLCPELTTNECALLEQSILDDGCREPITTMKGVILDGHNRYKICRKHKRPYKTKAINLPSREAAIAWVLVNQLGRRNLDASQRAMLAAKMPTIGKGGDRKSGGSEIKGANLPISKLPEIAEKFDVSERSVKSARRVIEKGTPSLVKAVEAGEIPVSVAAIASEMPKAKQKALVAEGREAVKAAVKQYNDSFDTEKLNAKKSANGKPKEFNDGMVEKLYGQLTRVLDDKTQVSGSGGGNGAECRSHLKASYKSFLAWSGRKK
jgi:hypothetical protein